MKLSDILTLVTFGSAMLFAIYLTLPPELTGSHPVASAHYTAWPLGKL